jgi:hypothetical protein
LSLLYSSVQAHQRRAGSIAVPNGANPQVPLPFTRANFDAYGTGTYGAFSSGNGLGNRSAAHDRVL